MEQFKVKDPDFEKRVRDSFARQGFMDFIGAQITAVEPGYCEIQIPYRHELTQQHGYFHAGIIGTVADNVGGYAAFTLMEATSSILTVEYKINFLSPGRGELLIGRGRVIKPGKTITLCRCDVFVIDNAVERHCAAAQMTLMNMQNAPDAPQHMKP
ncbi:MAG: PaaI family thioesterase [Desulfobacterales bacterium]|nr:PaaI family thioesterase [Desulfobacterales bacterium]